MRSKNSNSDTEVSNTDQAAKSADLKRERELHWTDLMKRAQAGEATAYEELLSDLTMVLRPYCNRFLGPMGCTEDAVQESLIAIHRARHTYNSKRPFAPWMFTIVRHKVIDCFRKEQRLNRQIADGVDPESGSYVRHRELGRDLKKFIQELKPVSRMAIVLCKIEGLKVSEAAIKLGISEANMKVRVHRAIKELAKLMELEEL